MTNLLWIALGGAGGALCRFGLGEAVQKLLGPGFAWGTLTVNLLGCGLIGLAFHVISATGTVPHEVRFLAVVGFLGSFTTFSTFSLENLNFLRDGQYLTAAIYTAVSVLGGLGLCFLGWRVGHLLLGPGGE